LVQIIGQDRTAGEKKIRKKKNKRCDFLPPSLTEVRRGNYPSLSESQVAIRTGKEDFNHVKWTRNSSY
jgi:hypothetical protein